MNFLKTSFYSGIGTAVSLALRLITNKVMAVYLSTDGMFLLGQLKDFLKISNVINHAGTLNGTISYTAKHKDDPSELKRIWGTGFLIHVVCSALLMAVIALFSDRLSVYLFGTSEYATIVTVLGFSMLTISLQLLIMSVLNGLKRIKLYITIQIIAAILSSVIVVFLIIEYGIEGALWAFAIGQVLSFLVAAAALMVVKPFAFQHFFSGFDKIAFQQLLKYSVMAVAGPLCLVAATFFIRSFLATEFDRQHAGSWEGMWRLSAMYLLFLTTTFKFYLIPTFSELEGKSLKQEVFKVWRFILPVVILIAVVLYMLRDWVINLFLAEDFYLIGVLIGFHLLGDIIKINSWVLGNILIAKAKTKVFVAFQVEWAIVFTALTLILCKNYGFVGVSMAYFGAYIVHFTLMNLYFRKLIWSKHT
ncbi:MAG: O-antigen translocase [Flavobacteriaceae bacterium]|nr:O-antigen translocase [Flavobacteriaceae bacterium]